MSNLSRSHFRAKLATTVAPGLALVAALALSSAHAWALGSTPVTITNPSVNIDGTVSVSNPADPTAFAKAPNAIQHPFAMSNQCFFAGDTVCKITFDFSRTNPNQIIVIEDASGTCIISSGFQLLEAQVDAMAGEVFLPISDHIGAPFGTNSRLFTVSQFVHFSVIPNQAVDFLVEATAPSVGQSCFLALTGEAIDQ